MIEEASQAWASRAHSSYTKPPACLGSSRGQNRQAEQRTGDREKSEEPEKWDMWRVGWEGWGGRCHLNETLHISLQVDDGHSLHDNVDDPPLQGLPLESCSLTEALAGSLLLELLPGRQRQGGFGWLL